jgi:5-methylcytosine-specific restriction endonuclease McrA
MNPHYADAALRAGHRCEYCRAPEAVFNFPFEVEHVVPSARGGLDEDANRALACRSCNLRKSDHVRASTKIRAPRSRCFTHELTAGKYTSV